MDERELIVSHRELHRIHVVRLTLEGRESVGRGAEFLGISTRQIKRLRKKMRERGVEGLLHGNRGRRPWNRTVKEVVKRVLGLTQGRYKGLNDTHLTEKLGEAALCAQAQSELSKGDLRVRQHFSVRESRHVLAQVDLLP